MSDMELLLWAKGTGLQIAGIIFIVGMILRVLEILLLGRKRDLAEARGSGMLAGLRTIITRSVPPRGMWSHLIAGYIFHIGFIVALLLFTPHILLFKDAFGWHWNGLSNSIIDVVTVISIAALIFALVARITDPVRRFLSNFGDYLALVVTLLPLLTGYLAFHRLGLPYTQMLAIHVLSVDLLLVIMPFTKLTHSVTFIFARWYNGAIAGRKGVRV
jgi:nitrate reductase gamma subunit